MNRHQRIQLILQKNFKNCKVYVHDNSKDHIGHNNFNGLQETHFKIKLEKIFDKNVSRISIHRKINKLLESEFISGLHALEIKIV